MKFSIWPTGGSVFNRLLGRVGAPLAVAGTLSSKTETSCNSSCLGFSSERLPATTSASTSREPTSDTSRFGHPVAILAASTAGAACSHGLPAPACSVRALDSPNWDKPLTRGLGVWGFWRGF